MKKLCILLAVIILLVGCGKESIQAEKTTCHTDQNDDGLCEVCGESMLVTVDIYTINDLHGKFADTDYQPGVDELSTYLKQVQQSGNTLLLATGDLWQGTAQSALTRGQIITQWMNDLGFAAMTLGGHEYDWGEETVRENRNLAQFPFLAINIYDRETDQPVDYCQSSMVVEMGGVQIGIIGAIGNCYYSIAAEHSTGFYFKNGAELTALVKAEAEKLRSQGVDFIIYALHDGYNQTTSGDQVLHVGNKEIGDYYDTSLSQGYVDLVFEADSHYWYNLQDQQGIYHLQAGGNNQGISHATVLINKANSNSQVLTAELLSTAEYTHRDADPMVAELLEQYAQQIAPAEKILGTNGQYRNSKAVCQLVADLYCEKGLEKWGAEYDIVLGGGYMSCRSPSFLAQGQVDYSLLYSLLPFDNRITLCSIQGRDLIEKFLETEHYAYYIKLSPYGEQVKQLIDPDKIYYVVTDSYSANYAKNNMTIIDTYAPDIFARDLLAEHIQEGNLK